MNLEQKHNFDIQKLTKKIIESANIPARKFHIPSKEIFLSPENSIVFLQPMDYILDVEKHLCIPYHKIDECENKILESIEVFIKTNSPKGIGIVCDTNCKISHCITGETYNLIYTGEEMYHPDTGKLLTKDDCTVANITITFFVAYFNIDSGLTVAEVRDIMKYNNGCTCHIREKKNQLSSVQEMNKSINDSVVGLDEVLNILDKHEVSYNISTEIIRNDAKYWNRSMYIDVERGFTTQMRFNYLTGKENTLLKNIKSTTLTINPSKNGTIQ